MLRAASFALALFTVPLCAQHTAVRASGSSGGASVHQAPAARSSFSFSAPSRSFNAPHLYSLPKGPTTQNLRFAGASNRQNYGQHRGGNGNGYRSGYPNGYPGGYGGYGYGGTGYALSPFEIGYADFAGFDDGYNPNIATQPEITQGRNQGYVDQGYSGQGYVSPSNVSSEPQYAPSNSAETSGPAPANYAAAAPLAPEDAVTLIYKDGHSEQIHNYALTRTTLYITDKHHREVSLDELNVPATEQANHDAGVDFTLPVLK